MSKENGWMFSEFRPRSRTEVQKFDNDAFEGAVVRTIHERAIVGVPVDQAEDPDADEIERLIADYNNQQSRSQNGSDSQRSVVKDEAATEPKEVIHEIRDKVARGVHQFEAARQRLHNLLRKSKDEPPEQMEVIELSDRFVCERCRDVDLEVLLEENKVLKMKLASSQNENREEFSCKCQMRQKVDKLKREEQSLLDIIGLKLERVEALKAQNHEAEVTLEQAKMKLCTRLAERNKIENLLNAAEDAFSYKCKQTREFQIENKRSEGRVKKLREEAKVATCKLSDAEKQVKNLHSQLSKLQAECRAKEEVVLKHRSTMVQLDDTAVKMRSEIKNLKEELQMLAESLKFHRREVEERNKEAQALNLDEQQAQKQLESQKRATQTQKEELTAEMERTKALEFVAHKCLQESEELSKALQRLRVSKKNVNADLLEVKRELGCKEAEVEVHVDMLETIKKTLADLKNERCNVSEMLLQQVRRDRTKIKSLLDDIEALGALLCEAIYIRSLIDRDNTALQGAFNQSNCPKEQEQEASDLEQQIDKHRRLIESLSNKMNDFERSHQNSEDADERVMRLTYQRVRTVTDALEK